MTTTYSVVIVDCAGNVKVQELAGTASLMAQLADTDFDNNGVLVFAGPRVRFSKGRPRHLLLPEGPLPVAKKAEPDLTPDEEYGLS